MEETPVSDTVNTTPSKRRTQTKKIQRECTRAMGKDVSPALTRLVKILTEAGVVELSEILALFTGEDTAQRVYEFLRALKISKDTKRRVDAVLTTVMHIVLLAVVRNGDKERNPVLFSQYTDRHQSMMFEPKKKRRRPDPITSLLRSEDLSEEEKTALMLVMNLMQNKKKKITENNN